MAKTEMINEEIRPVTAEDHKKLNSRHQAVNEVLKLPVGDAFDEAITEILEGDVQEKGETVVIALIDIDEFAHVNVDFGTQEGDRVIIETGRYIIENAGPDATVFKIGEDEFGIIFKGLTEREDIFLRLNELKNGYNVTLPDGEKMTVTIGMATAFEDASRCTELIRKADSALFRAKAAGRNRIAMAKEEKMVPKTSHYTQDQLKRLTMLSKREGVGEAILLREALDMLLKKYDV